jgi:hypothetical protein
MNKLAGVHTFSIALSADASPYVERATPGGAPTAFRIWAAGENQSDDGATIFSEKSAALLMAEQEKRGRQYPSDFDHLSLVSDRPAESGRASGYHRLECRPSATGPELWAVDIEWCGDVREGLEQSPPLWKYFSPAFKQDEKAEVYSYVNFAICINPKTHKLPSLAGIGNGDRESNMNKKAMRAFLAKMAEGASDDAAKTAYSTIAAALGDDDAEDGSSKEKEPQANAEGADETKKDAEPPPPPGDGDKKEEPKKDAADPKDDDVKKDAIGGELASDLAKANARIAALEIKGMLDARVDLADSIKKWCLTQDSATVRSYLSAHPKSAAQRNATPVVASVTPVGLQGRELEEMNAAMGMQTHAVKGPERREDGTFVLHTVRPSDMAKLATQQKGQG